MSEMITRTMRWSPSSATRPTVCWTVTRRTLRRAAVRLWLWCESPDGVGGVGTAFRKGGAAPCRTTATQG